MARTNQQCNGRVIGIALEAGWNAACLLPERRCAASNPAAASIARADAAAIITHDGQHSKVNIWRNRTVLVAPPHEGKMQVAICNIEGTVYSNGMAVFDLKYRFTPCL